MTFSLTEEAAARPRLTIHAAEILYSQARDIAQACEAATREEIVLARVDPFLSAVDVSTIRRADLVAHAGGGTGGGWMLIFSPGADLDEIRLRCLELARTAFKRWEALRRWEGAHES